MKYSIEIAGNNLETDDKEEVIKFIEEMTEPAYIPPDMGYGDISGTCSG